MRNKRIFISSLVCIGLVVLLTSIYMFNFLDQSNQEMFETFQKDSEELIIHTINLTREEGELHRGLGIIDYSSNFGLQGYLFAIVAAIFPNIYFCNLIAAGAAAMIVALIAYELWGGFSKGFSCVFVAVMMFSPWIVSMARNLYWVMFTWLIPIWVGLLYFNNRFINKIWLYYLLTFISVFIKCLCGYEFITTILISMMIFPVLKMLENPSGKAIIKSAKFKECFWAGFLGCFAVICAIMLHAYVFGKGNLIEGLDHVYYTSSYRMAWATESGIETLANGNTVLYEVLEETLNVNVFTVIFTYFCFTTPVLIGVPAIVFPITSVTALAFAFVDCLKQKKLTQNAIMYILSFLAVISWMVLAKPHAYAHRHIVYILWYIQFIPVVFFINLQWIGNAIKKLKRSITKSQ